MALLVTPIAAYLVLLLWTSLPFAPAEPLLVAAGSWSAAGGLLFPLVVAAATVGSVLSDLAKYGLGRLVGPVLLRRLSRHRSGARAIAWTEARLVRYGPAVIIPSYFVPFGAVVSTVLCGALRMPLRTVAVASALGAALWSALFVSLGFLGGIVAGSPVIGVAIALPAALAIGLLVGRRTTGRQDPATVRGDQGQERSNSPALTPVTNAAHSSGVKTRGARLRSFPSRTANAPSGS